MCYPNGSKKEGSKPESEEVHFPPAKNPRHAIELASALNASVGHENYGSLSFSHGFAPQLTPPPRLPSAFEKWEELGDRLPELWSSGRLQKYIDEDFPTLDPTLLPPECALRAAHILGITIHAYWHVGGLRAPDGGEEFVPKNLERPWYYLVTKMLYRDQPFMGFYEMLISAFNYPPERAPKPLPDQRVPWYNEQKKKLGQVEYNPGGVRLSTLDQVVSLSGVITEKAFFCSFNEMNCRCYKMVEYLVVAQEAANELEELGFRDSDMSFVGHPARERLSKALSNLAKELHLFTDAFNLIHGMRKSETYVDPTVWAEAVAPVDKPFPGVKVGPSGAGMPLTIMLDAFFQRSEHGNFVGKAVQEQLSLYPPNWIRFIHSVREYAAVGPMISAGQDAELKGLFAEMLRAYAGEEGFLGVHRLKFYGYMEFTKKLARGKVKGYVGLLRQRVWTRIGQFMADAMRERFKIPLDAKCSVGQVAKVIPAEVNDNESSLHFRLDVEGTGIQTFPGDRMGVLYEADEALVNDSLRALATYGGKSYEEFAKLPVKLNEKWRNALRGRPQYHSSLGLKYDDAKEESIVPYEIPLSVFLRYAKLRPADRNMVRLAYAATLNPILLKFLETHRENMLQAPDLIHLFCRAHSNASSMLILRNENSEFDATALFEKNLEKMFEYADVDKDRYISKKSMVRIGKAVSDKISAVDDITAIFDKFDTDQTGQLDFTKFKNMVFSIVKGESSEASIEDIFKAPLFCEMFQPITFRVYSIASADKTAPGEVHLCVEKVKYTQKDPISMVSAAFSDLEPLQDRFGAGSNFMTKRTAEMDVSKREVVIQHYRQPSFQLPPEESAVPILMFAAGSGIAPFRSFWQEIAIRRANAIKAKKPLPPKPLLVLQARTRDLVPYVTELASLAGSNVLDVEIYLSREDYTPDFSSGKPNWIPGKRQYVHKAILEGGPLRERLATDLSLEGEGYVYMCSGTGFASNLVNGISDIIGEEGIELMMSKTRLKLEVFTSLNKSADLQNIKLSDFMFKNNYPDEKAPLEMVIDGLVYDIKAFEARHPGGTEILYLYCGMDASVPWRSVGHDEASEVKSQLDIYLLGRLYTALDNVHLACSDAKVQITTPSNETKNTTLRRYYSETWDPMATLFMESQNIVLLAMTQFWDGRAKMTAAEPDASEGHLCTWEGKSYYQRRKSVLQGQMFTASHRKIWVELLPTIFDKEFNIGISALSPEGANAEFAKLRNSDDHLKTSALVDLLEEMIVEYVDEGSPQARDGRVPADMQAFFDAVRVLDEKLFSDMKMGITKIIASFENYGEGNDPEESKSSAGDLLDEVESGAMEIVKSLSYFCASAASLATNFFDEEQVERAKTRLMQSDDCGGLCHAYALTKE